MSAAGATRRPILTDGRSDAAADSVATPRAATLRAVDRLTAPRVYHHSIGSVQRPGLNR